MYKDKKLAAIIPARKGSKGIPNKNTVLLKGLPLIEHTLIQVEKVSCLDKVIVSTDSEEIIELANNYKVEIKGLRPAELSSDTAILYDVLRYEISNHKLVEEGFDIIVLLQPTCPLRPNYIIENALKTFVDEAQKSAVGVSEVEDHPVFIRTIDQSKQLVKLLNTDSTIRRQDLPKYYKINGMIYINSVNDIVNGYVNLNENLSPIIIAKEFDVDIDTIEDLEIAEIRLDRLKEQGKI